MCVCVGGGGWFRSGGGGGGDRVCVRVYIRVSVYVCFLYCMSSIVDLWWLSFTQRLMAKKDVALY